MERKWYEIASVTRPQGHIYLGYKSQEILMCVRDVDALQLLVQKELAGFVIEAGDADDLRVPVEWRTMRCQYLLHDRYCGTGDQIHYVLVSEEPL